MEKEKKIELIEEIEKFIGISGRSNKIEFYLNEFTNKIKSVCKRKDFPEELEYLAKQYAINNISVLDENGNEKKEISSMSDQGQTVTFSNNTSLKKEDIDLSLFIEKNKSEIAQYAYMGW